MVYKIINSGKMRFQRALINCLMIISYITTFSSCTTTEMSYLSPDSFETGSPEKITKIELKNGNIINCKDKLIKIEKKSDSTGFLVIASADTVKTGSNRYTIQLKEQRIPEKDVLKIHLENTKIDGLKTAFLGLGIAAGALIAFYIVVGIAISKAHLK